MFEPDAAALGQRDVVIAEHPSGWVTAAVSRDSPLAAYFTRLASAWNGRQKLSVTRTGAASTYNDSALRDAAENAARIELAATAIRRGLTPVTAADLRWSVLSREPDGRGAPPVEGAQRLSGWVHLEVVDGVVVDSSDTVVLDAVMLVIAAPPPPPRPRVGTYGR